MLTITIPGVEMFNEKTMEFLSTPETTLVLEHSLISLSKWEAIWHKPFLSQENMNDEETASYIKCMTITQHVNDDVYKAITANNLKDVRDYIANPMSATTFTEYAKSAGGKNTEIVTSEVIYGQMVALQIPFECEKWHLNRLLTLIKVCNLRNQPQKKMSKSEILSRNAKLNAERRAKFNSKG